MGKWAALNRGFLIGIDEGADVVITLDGDAQHDSKEIPKLLNLLSNGIDMALVLGSLITGCP